MLDLRWSEIYCRQKNTHWGIIEYASMGYLNAKFYEERFVSRWISILNLNG